MTVAPEVVWESATDTRCTVRVEGVSLTFVRGKNKLIIARDADPDVRQRVGDEAFTLALREARRVMDMPAAERLEMMPPLSGEDKAAVRERIGHLKRIINEKSPAEHVARIREELKKKGGR